MRFPRVIGCTSVIQLTHRGPVLTPSRPAADTINAHALADRRRHGGTPGRSPSACSPGGRVTTEADGFAAHEGTDFLVKAADGNIGHSIFCSAAPLCGATCSVLSLLIPYCGSSANPGPGSVQCFKRQAIRLKMSFKA